MTPQPSIYTTDELKLLDKTAVPSHIAIIPDGNRRWAKKKLFPLLQGHIAGADTVVTTLRAAKELGVKALTLYAFSTENWKRPEHEVSHLMQTIELYLNRYQKKLIESQVRFRAIGRLEGLSKGLRSLIDTTCKLTENCTEFDFVLAINYGGRDELCRAIQRLLLEKVPVESITERMIAEYLDTKGIPDPDLLIRTSGEKRISNFLLWQSSYAELYIDDIAWPEFTPKHLLQAVCDYQRRQRRIGGGTP